MFVEPYGVKEQNAKYPNNIGKQTEREVRYAMTGEWLNADNAKGGADCKGWQIKTFRATVCYGTDIEHLFVEHCHRHFRVFHALKLATNQFLLNLTQQVGSSHWSF